MANLSTLVGYFEEAEQATTQSRAESELHRDYYDGAQWTSEEASKLNERKQPPVTDNKIKDKIDTLLGMEIAIRTDPKAFPRTPAHESAAQAATDAIRFVADNNRLPQVKSEVGNQLFVEGTGGASVTVDQKGQIRVKHIQWDRIFVDPHSRRKDYEDARYAGEAIWMDAEIAKRKYPGHEDEFDLTLSETHSKFGETYADKPLLSWVDPKRARVRIVEIYYWDREWQRALIAKHSLIEGPKPSVYKDEDGERIHPYVLRSAYVDRNGFRYGVVRRYKDLQDEQNKRRSKLLHLASARTIIADAGAVDSIETAKKELSKPDGWITVNPDKRFDVLENVTEIATHAQLLAQTGAALDATGPNAALVGASGNLSGRAKQIDQQAGTVNLGTLFDGLRDWELRCYRKIWNCIRQFWTEEKWIRVRDDERNLKFLVLNHKKTQGEAYNEMVETALETDAPIDQIPLPQDPDLPVLTSDGQPIIENSVVDLDVDIIIEQAPDIVSIQQEQFAELSQLAQSGVPIPADVIIEASSLRNKKQLLAMMRGDTPEQRQQAKLSQQLQETLINMDLIMRELGIEKESAEIDKIRSETAENLSQADSNVVEAFLAGEGKEKIG